MIYSPTGPSIFETLMGEDEIIMKKKTDEEHETGREFLYQNLEFWSRMYKNCYLSLLPYWRLSVNLTKDRWRIIIIIIIWDTKN